MKSCHWGEKISELLNGETGPQIEILQLMISNSEGREDVELVWDDWGHERDVRDHTGDGWDHVEDVVVVGESTKIHENKSLKIQILQIFTIYLEM